MARPDPSSPRRGRRGGRRRWGISGGAAPPPAPTQPTLHLNTESPTPDPTPYEPRRRYPWHDDPDYDPAAHRRAPAPPSWTPPGRAQPYQPPPHRSQPNPSPPPGPPPHQNPAHQNPAHSPGSEQPAPRDQATPPPRPDARDQVQWTDAGPPPVDGAAADHGADGDGSARRIPRMLTVTRVAALRSRELTQGGIRAFRRAATADGADRSGLTALTYATMMTYAVDAAVAVALANTLFFAAATAESKANVALYLAITVAPFALVAPVIGPMLDRLQRGRRAALAVSFAGRAALAVVMAFEYDTWLLYPAALGVLVLSKSFAVLKAAVTPRVLPHAITLVTTNSRLTAFGLAAGGVFGAVAAGVAVLWGSPGALLYTAALAVVGAVLCLRIPRWVESTAGEVPAALGTTARGRRRPMGRRVVVALWGNGAIRVLTGFLTLFVAFVIKGQSEADPARQLLLIGIVGVAAGVGAFGGNAVGARRRFGRSDGVILACIAAAVAAAVLAALLPGIGTAAVVGLVGASASALAKVSLDAVVQRDLPEESRASAFGRSETVLQLAWVFGGALGVLLPHSTFWIGFTVVAAVVALAGVQTALVSRGRSLLPFLGHRAESVTTVAPARSGSTP